MKTFFAFCCLLLVGHVTSTQAQGVKTFAFDPLINKVIAVKWISNYDPGFGSPNEFYKLSKELVQTHSSAEFKRMVDHRNPIVRAMGLLCLIQATNDDSIFIILSHWKDDGVVYLHQGCNVSKITVGEFAQRLLSNPRYLDV